MRVFHSPGEVACRSRLEGSRSMKKKAPEKVQGVPSKSQKTNGLPASKSAFDSPVRASKPTKITEDPRFAQAVQNYEAGLKSLQSHKYDKAKAYLEKVIGSCPELADRAATHLNTCNQHINDGAATFKNPEERYDFAVSLMNMGDYVSAREIFSELTQKHPKLDFVWYGAAALSCLMGHFPDAISGLSEAIRLNPANRYQARNDSDFQSLSDDPRFTELLYPDSSAEMPPDAHGWHF
jgi:tetratricopeptide (TPR) repeat protein